MVRDIFKYFQNVTAFSTYITNAQHQEGMKHSHYSINARDNEWAGTKSWEDAQYIMLNGDRKSAAKIGDTGVNDTMRKITALATKHTLKSCVVGCAVNVPAFLAGTPCNMIQRTTQRAKRRFVTVTFNASINCNVTAEDYIVACANLLTAVAMLEASGVRVQINITNVYSTKYNSIDDKGVQVCAFAVTVKEYGQKLDINKLAYCMVNPSFSRRHAFRFIETAKGVSNKFEQSYGYALTDRTTIAHYLQKHNIEGCVFNYYSIEGKTTGQILDMIRECK